MGELKRQQAQAKLDSVKNKLVKRKAEKELMDIRTKVKKTDAVEEFIKKEQSKAENEEDFEGDYECPIIKDKARKKMEIQKELKALTKELEEHNEGYIPDFGLCRDGTCRRIRSRVRRGRRQVVFRQLHLQLGASERHHLGLWPHLPYNCGSRRCGPLLPLSRISKQFKWLWKLRQLIPKLQLQLCQIQQRCLWLPRNEHHPMDLHAPRYL